jgi:hypothetical protein
MGLSRATAVAGGQLDAAVLYLQRPHQLGAVRGETVLQADACKRRRKLAQVGRRRTDQARELAEAPMGRRNRPRPDVLFSGGIAGNGSLLDKTETERLAAKR